MFRSIVCFAFGVLLCLPAEEGRAGERFIQGGRLLTVTHGEIERGSILIREGKIAAFGADLTPPADADLEIIDATGKVVMPGIVDAHSHMGVYSWPGVKAHADGNEMTDPITPQIRAIDAVNPEDPAFARAVAGGVTTVLVLPGSGNLIGGQGVVLKLRLGGGVERMRMKGAPPQLKMAIGENPKRVYGEKKRMPSTRMGNFYLLRKAFTDAQEYIAKWERYEKKKGEDPTTPPPPRDLALETLADVLRGKFQVQIHCYRQDGILHLIELADTFGFRIAAFHHALEAYKVADEIAARDIGVATFTDWWGYKVEAWDGIPYNAALLAQKGVRVAIKSDSGAFVQQLFTEAAKAMRYGLSRDAALRAITLTPASILGVEERIGSIDVGKDADLVIFDRDPFDIYTRVEMTIIDGEVAFVREGAKR